MAAALQSPDVLIVGAGPTGLMLALQLARRGVAVRIVDRNAGPSKESRAVVVQARTLEYFRQLGFGDEAVREGRPIFRARLLHAGRIRAEIPLGRLGLGFTRYPFVLSLGQDQTEALLVSKLAEVGVRVERLTEAVRIEDLGGALRVTLRRSSAEAAPVEEVVETPWLCGADGASSVVRHAMGIGFEGGTYEHRFYLADCRVDGPVADDGVSISPGAPGLVAFFAMAGERRFRVIGRVPAELAPDGAAPSLPFDVIAPLATRASALPISLSEPRWTSVYRLHHRCAAKLRAGREGRVFILGDAAHVHSPVGGQGMNTGLQDATNLAWKLAMVVRGGASPALLDSFEEERLPVARRLLRTTDRIFTFATDDRGVVSAVRSFFVYVIAPRLLGIGRLRRAAFRVVSQTGIGYGDGSLAAAARRGGAATAPDTAPPGLRLCHVEIAAGDAVPRDAADLCESGWFTAIVVGAVHATRADDALAALDAELAAFPALAPLVARRSIPAIDANRAALEVFGALPAVPPSRRARSAAAAPPARDASPRLVIVRPDLHLFGCWPLGRARDALACLDAALRAGAA